MTIGYHVPRNDVLAGLDPDGTEGVACPQSSARRSTLSQERMVLRFLPARPEVSILPM